MFDELKVPPQKPTWVGARILAGSVAGVLVSLGLCGVGAKLQPHAYVTWLGMVGFALFFLSCLAAMAGVISLATDLIREIGRNIRKED